MILCNFESLSICFPKVCFFQMYRFLSLSLKWLPELNEMILSWSQYITISLYFIQSLAMIETIMVTLLHHLCCKSNFLCGMTKFTLLFYLRRSGCNQILKWRIIKFVQHQKKDKLVDFIHSRCYIFVPTQDIKHHN